MSSLILHNPNLDHLCVCFRRLLFSRLPTSGCTFHDVDNGCDPHARCHEAAGEAAEAQQCYQRAADEGNSAAALALARLTGDPAPLRNMVNAQSEVRPPIVWSLKLHHGCCAGQ